ncbi:MAG TPA: MlaD family protein [Gemmatimonadaceae bacterium]|jgi:phospholipid/cholesterol/gamma-HCH transport system substrate-binding protein
MKRSSFITWDQLRVGLVVLAALGILTLAVYKLGQAANLFAKRYDLVAFLKEANGLRVGGTVTLAGQLAGTVKKIEFLPVDADTSRNLKITVAVDQDLQQQIRGDSRAQIRTLGLLGDKIMDISPGSPRFPALKSGDTIHVSPALDYEQVLAQAAGAVGDVVELTRDLRQLTGGIVRGEGTIGQLVTNRGLYDELIGTLGRTNTMLVKLQNPNGTVGRLLDDPTLYMQITGMIASTDSLLRTVNSPHGTLGRMMRDTVLYGNMVDISRGADSLMHMLTTGNGLAAKLLTDQTLYDQLNKLVTDLNAVLADVRRDPARYTKGAIQVRIF